MTTLASELVPSTTLSDITTISTPSPPPPSTLLSSLPEGDTPTLSLLSEPVTGGQISAVLPSQTPPHTLIPSPTATAVPVSAHPTLVTSSTDTASSSTISATPEPATTVTIDPTLGVTLVLPAHRDCTPWADYCTTYSGRKDGSVTVTLPDIDLLTITDPTEWVTTTILPWVSPHKRAR
jgi:hypothetical protein